MPRKIVLLNEGIPETPEKWERVTLGSSSLIVRMPIDPEVKKKQYHLPPLGQVTETRYYAGIRVNNNEISTEVYLFTDLPDNVAPSKLREAVRDRFLFENTELRKESIITQNGNEGSECEIYWNRDEGFYLTFRFFVVKDRVFAALYARSGVANPDAAKRYLDSFLIPNYVK